jgi:hypothetical protein
MSRYQVAIHLKNLGSLDAIVQTLNGLHGSQHYVPEQAKTYKVQNIMQFQILYVQGTPEAIVLIEAEEM